MPILRYFFFVGAALLALLFVVGEVFPGSAEQSAVATGTTASDVSMIRIRSDRKWPERVVFDTSVSASSPTPLVASMADPVRVAVSQTPAPPADGVDGGTKVTARDAFAQARPADVTKVEAKPQPKRKIARKHVAPPPMQIAQRPQFGLFANNIW